MPGEASISALLDCAQRLLGDEIAPHLDTERRYLALMIGSAMRMAAREAEQAERLAAAQAALLDLADGVAAALVEAIRDGALDADPRAHDLLWADAVIRTSVTKPSALSRVERGIAGLPGDPVVG